MCERERERERAWDEATKLGNIMRIKCTDKEGFGEREVGTSITFVYLKLKEGGQMLSTLLFNVVTKSGFTLMYYNISLDFQALSLQAYKL